MEEAVLLQKFCQFKKFYQGFQGALPLTYRVDHKPLVYRDRVSGIDTGCCHGGRLTGLLLPEFKLLSVPAQEDYWQRAQTRHVHLAQQEISKPEPQWTRAYFEYLKERLADASLLSRERQKIEKRLAEYNSAEKILHLYINRY